MKERDWIIHYVQNDDGTINAHTHGLKEQYNHKELQLALRYPMEDVCYILNSIGDKIATGNSYVAGEYLDFVYVDVLVRLDARKDDMGNDILRVIVPDDNGYWPEDIRCQEGYKEQLREDA